MNINEGTFELLHKNIVQPFENIENLKKDIFVGHMIGNTPFDSNYVVWSKMRRDIEVK
ncbi:hypothetical protein D3C74_424740 [compost metagenome]